jgi:hypothetical protein
MPLDITADYQLAGVRICLVLWDIVLSDDALDLIDVTKVESAVTPLVSATDIIAPTLLHP